MSKFLNFISSILLIIIGIALIYSYESVLFLVGLVMVVTLIMMIIRSVIQFMGKDEPKKAFMRIIVLTIFTVVFAIQPWFYTYALPNIYGWWALLNSLLLFFNYFVSIKDHHNHSWVVLLNALITLVFSVSLIFATRKYFSIFILIAGVYSLYMGIGQLLPLIFPKWKTNVKLPLALSYLLSPALIRWINSKVEDGTYGEEDVKITPNTKYKLEVFVYVKETGYEMSGHCNISFKGKTYAYGAYDYKTRRLHGLTGDGVLVVCDRDEYLKHMVLNEHKTAISFGLEIDENEEKQIQERIDELMSRSFEFPSDAELLERNEPIDSEAKDILSRMYRGAGAKFYHFHHGMFKTYSLVYTNCVYITNHLIKNKDIDLIDARGLITPGAYFGFLNNQYELKTGKVTSRTLFKDLEYYNSNFKK